MLENKPLIIGITGAFGSGKSTAAEILKSLGFTKISLVQFLEEELKNRGEKDITRQLLQDLGNEWREKYRPGILAKKALELISKREMKKVVVEGFRNDSEIDEFRKQGNFKLIGIVVNRKIRFDRLKKLKRREELNWQLFNKLDNRDLGIGEGKKGLQVAICLALSDIFIENNSSLGELKNKIQDALKEN
ncbi:MAG: dephospho-CoA kinase [Candidatus Levybacteria bacterium]|nr:dephospho-CoA kinase [Candidatus Levybacteria bacterium]